MGMGTQQAHGFIYIYLYAHGSLPCLLHGRFPRMQSISWFGNIKLAGANDGRILERINAYTPGLTVYFWVVVVITALLNGNCSRDVSMMEWTPYIKKLSGFNEEVHVDHTPF